MKIWHLFFLFYCSTFALFSHDNIEQDSDPIVVKIETETTLNPLYFAGIEQDRNQFSEPSIKQLEQVVAFDFSHNGMTKLIKRSSSLDQLASNSNLGDLSSWNQQGIFYVIKGNIQGDQLSFALLNVVEGTLKKTASVSLTGDLSKDRTSLHKLSDSIHKALFGIDGIASTHLIYTVKNPASKSEKWVSEVWESDYDGANAHPLTHQQYFCVTPCYVPPKPGYASGTFMYVSYQLGQPKIYMASTRDGIGHRLTFMRGNQLTPAISLQRDKVAFISDITGNPDLFLQPFHPEKGTTGKPYQIFSARQATQGSPTFSPDGSKIAFVSDKDGSPKIYVIDIPEPGTSLKEIKATLISKRNRENTAPSWSPDGNKIAYCARNQGERQIWVYDLKSHKEKQLTQGPGNKENPSWAPNSLHLTFNSSDANSCDLFILNLNQEEAIQITSGVGEKRFPNWEPR